MNSHLHGMELRVDYDVIKEVSVTEMRAVIRAGAYSGHTAGLGKGLLQANLVILPAEHALDFARFCLRNPKPCPVVGVSDTGNPNMFTLGSDIDIRTDVPAYNVFRNGMLADCVTDIRDLWTGAGIGAVRQDHPELVVEF